MAGHVLLHLATTTAKSPAAGAETAIWVALGLACGGGLLALYIWILGRARLQRPDLERWEEGDEPAWESPPLLEGLRARGQAPRLHSRVRV